MNGALSPGDTRILKGDVEALLNEKATVYGPDPITKRFTLVVKSGLKCMLRRLVSNQDAGARDELARRRQLWFDADYVMPEEDVELLISGARWTPLAGTGSSVGGTLADPAVRMVDIVEARS